MGADQLGRALPDQRTDARRLAFQIERGAQAANDGVGAQRSQRRTGHVEDHQKHKACHSKSNPRRPEPALNGAHETAAAFLGAGPAAQPQQEEQNENEEAGQPAQQRAATLGEQNSKALHRQDEQVEPGQHGVHGHMPRVIAPQQPAQMLQQPLQRQEKRHDQVGGHEDRVAHVAGDAPLNVAAPRQRIESGSLQQTVDGNRHADDDNRVGHAPPLLGPPQVSQHQEKDHDVGQHGVGALQALVGAEKADTRVERKDRADQVGKDQQQRRQHQRRAGDTAPQGDLLTIVAATTTDTIVEHFDQPRNGHHQRDGAQHADLVRLKYPAGVNVEEKRHINERRQPSCFDDCLAEAS